MRALIDGDIPVTVWTDANGYVRTGKHPGQYMHRLLVEKALGRKLKGAECVHHVDGNKANNTPSNLVVCPDQSYHALLHARQRVVDKGGNPETEKYCKYHGELHKKEEFSKNHRMYDGRHNVCKDATNEYRRNRGINKGKFGWKERLNQQYRRVFAGYTKREFTKL